MSQAPHLTSRRQGDRLELVASGAWTGAHIELLERTVEASAPDVGKASSLSVELGEVQELDTAGAWLLERLIRSGSGEGRKAEFVGTPVRFRGLLDEVRGVNRKPPVRRKTPYAVIRTLDAIGRGTAGLKGSAEIFLEMFGAISAALLRVMTRPRSFRFTSAVHHVNRVGWQALPIILLITFLIGCIISQQGIFHFRKFGADIFVVDMLGVLVLREIGVLLVAIMVAGRSGSAYTAELGSMKMREEIDALRTMGFDPIEVLILPRMLALVLALPILAFLGAMAALYGGGLVAWLYGGVDPEAFLLRLRDAISIDHFIVGIIKAPVMAAVIGIVACVEGLAVQGSAESLGQHTTSSVVKGIFFVIVMDGVFAIFFASIGM